MTTGIRENRTGGGQRRPTRVPAWVWPAVVLVVVIALLVWAYYAAMPGPEGAMYTPNQKALTGSQESVGLFNQKLSEPAPNQKVNGASLNNPPGFGQPSPNAKPINGNLSNELGTNSGAGNTGISTSTGVIGGAPVANPKTGTNGTAAGNQSYPGGVSAGKNSRSQTDLNGQPPGPLY